EAVSLTAPASGRASLTWPAASEVAFFISAPVLSADSSSVSGRYSGFFCSVGIEASFYGVVVSLGHSRILDLLDARCHRIPALAARLDDMAPATEVTFRMSPVPLALTVAATSPRPSPAFSSGGPFGISHRRHHLRYH